MGKKKGDTIDNRYNNDGIKKKIKHLVESLNSEHDTEMTQGSILFIDRTTRIICHVGDMIRFPRYNGQEEE